MGDQKLDEKKAMKIRQLIQSEFPHLRSPGRVNDGDLQSAASKR
jgi:hypothetical protein